ncbi:MAG: histidine kinase dimerization/phospho-acceptor domain-containing protein, partial [Thermosynechococcaceae cyanobacterium]
MAFQIQKLSPATQEILRVAACQGGSFSEKFLENLVDMPLAELQTSLWEALQTGLVISDSAVYKLGQARTLHLGQQDIAAKEMNSSSFESVTDEEEYTYYFVHDRVQQAAYSLIPQDQQKILHLKIGYYLLNTLSTVEQKEKIFEIVNQLNIGIEYIQINSERIKLAKLNLRAGQKAKTATAYTDASKHCITGIQLLSPNGWDTEYELMLALHCGAAESALLMGFYENVKVLTQEIETKTKQNVDRVKAYQIRVEAYKAQGQVIKAINTGLSALNLLGIQILEQPQRQDFQIQFQETQLLLSNYAIKDLVNLPMMTDPEKLVIMEILGQLLPITYSYNPILFSVQILRLINLSLKHGNCPISSWAYIAYGVILWTASDNINIVHDFGKLGVTLSNRISIKEHLAKVNFAFNLFISCWKNHLKETLVSLLNNYALSLEIGDFVHASFSLVEYIEHSLWCGKSLTELEWEMAQYYESVTHLNQEVTLKFYDICWQAVLNLTDDTQSSKILSGKILDESIMLPYFQKTANRQAIFLLYLYKLHLCYLFCDYSEALQNSELAEAYLDSVHCRVVVVVFYFYRILSLLATCTDEQLAGRNSILEAAEKQTEQLKKWADSAPMNFLHKYYLVQAERHRVLGQYLEAIAAYDQAIALAQENEYLNEEALAHELAGLFYLGWGKTTIAQTYLINAYYAYERWGAKAKLRDLEQRHPNLQSIFQESKTHSQINPLTTLSEKTSITSQTNILDWAAVMQASQALSQEIDLDKLLETIMAVVIENAGAEQGSLLLIAESDLVLKAHCTMETCHIKRHTLFSEQTQALEKVPMSVINYVWRTQQALVLSNANAELKFATDPYVVKYQPRSILCMPIQRQGKQIGILYLQNNLATEAFTTDRLEVLQLLTAQAAISLENAQLYASVEQKVRDRTSELRVAKQEAERAKELSEQANRAKSDFLANISHELRTPLNAVLGYSQLLYRDPSISPEHKKKLVIINRSGEHLLTLINDVLTMAKIESGRTTLYETSFDLQVLLSSIHEMLSIKASSKNLRFDFECAQEIPQFIQTDEGKLRQVLINLLGNAIKFTQQGSVKLRVSLNSRESD